MKKLTLSLLAAVAVATPSMAGTVVTDYKQPAPPAPEPCFQDQEFSIDLFYSFNNGRPGRYHYLHDGSGGGVGLNYFFARYIGISVEGNWWGGARKGYDENTGRSSTSKRVVTHQVSGHLVLRYPVELSNFCFAPYIFGGGGGIWDGKGTGFGDVGAGVEFRITRNIGLFGDWRWNFTGNKSNDLDTTRAGIRFIF